MNAELIQPLLMAVMVGIASGSIGSFIVIRRMALVGDALSHVALPGIALALAYSIDPIWGVIVFLLTASLLVWWLGQRTKLPVDAIVGLIFTASLAVGILAIPDVEIFESLFGAFPQMSAGYLTALICAALLLSLVTFAYSGKLSFTTISRELASGAGIGNKYDLLLLVTFSLVLALGIKLVGTLLMGALTIVPAAIARNLCKSMRAYVTCSALMGAVIGALGLLIAFRFGYLPGPTIILVGIVFFLISLVAVPKNQN